MRVWIDIKNSHEPGFFKPFIERFDRYEFWVTSREYAEITMLLNMYGIKHISVGGHYGRNFLRKVIGRGIIRNLKLMLKVPYFDVALSYMSMESILISTLRRKNSISFTDNELPQLYTRIPTPFVDYLITPKAIPLQVLLSQGAKKNGVIQFEGFKEDIYIADYEPDRSFSRAIPFDDFVTIRPEALKAAYVSKDAKTIVPELFSEFSKKNISILYLPRYRDDMSYVKNYDNIYIPPAPLNGLDVCSYSRAVLTGSGTFAREAACMGTPAVSFFPDEKLLAVDQEMVKKGWVLHSRDPKKIVDYALNSDKRPDDLSRSKKVQEEVFNIVNDILEKCS